MATRDVILRALGDFCWNEEAPLRFAMLDLHDLGQLADVAARAVDGQKPVGTPDEAEACAGRSGLGLGDVEHHHIEEL